jgi:hypothetical protein
MSQHEQPDVTVPDLPTTKEIDRAARGSKLMMFGIVAGAVILTALAIGFASRSDTQTKAAVEATSQRDTAVAVKDDLAERAIALCSSGGPELEKLRAVGLCQKAAEAKQEQPAPAAVPEVSFAVVKDAVEAYLAANPPKDGHTPTPAELLPIVAQVYRDNPPKDGKTPSEAEILAVIQQVYAANPPAAGQDGKDGKDGKDAPCIAADADRPTADRCRGPAGRNGTDGAAGAAGVSVVSVKSATRNGVCYLDFTLSNQSVTSAEVSSRVCEDAPVPLVPRSTR